MQHGSILENLSIRLINNTEYVWTQTQGTNSQCLSVPSLFHSLLVSTLEEFNLDMNPFPYLQHKTTSVRVAVSS